MPDYQKGKIYRLYSVSNEELVYYGSTIETLSRRLSAHIRDYKNNSGCTSKKVIDAQDYKIELIENYPCANKQQLERREGCFIKNNVCVNEIIAGRTRKEYYEDNKEKIKECNKEQRKKYYENNKEHIKEQKKKYHENNKEKRLEQLKQYCKNNKEKIKEKAKEKVTCECGCVVRKSDLARHKKSNKHLKLMQ